MWPMLAFAGALILLPTAILRAIRKREQYCGKGPDPCFWCRRKCDYYNLHGADTPGA